MRGNTGSLAKRIRAAALSMVAVGMLYGSACTWGDLRLNLVNGTLSFVKGYTTDLWEAVFPVPDEFIGVDD
jgi:hypothetical protein